MTVQAADPDALEATRYALEMLRSIDETQLTPLEQRERNRLIARTGYLIDSLEWRDLRDGLEHEEPLTVLTGAD